MVYTLYMKYTLIFIIIAAVAGAGYYFGYDRGLKKEVEETTPNEHAGLMTEQDRVNAATSALVGVWQSADDAKFIRTYRANGTASDTYEDEPSANVDGTWRVFMKELPDLDFKGIIEADVPYVKMTLDGEHYFFKVGKATPEELELIFLDRGGVLMFTRVP